MESKNEPKLPDKIRRTCEYVSRNSSSIKINEKKIQEFVESKIDLLDNIPTWTSCHCDPNNYEIELIVSLICVIDSLNFCFWPLENTDHKKEFEYGDMVTNIIDLLNKAPDFFKVENLANLTIDSLTKNIFNGIEDFPLLEERTRSLNELGYFIKNKHQSKFINFIFQNNNDCVEIATKIAEGVSTFRDETIYRGRQIFIYKRAQILSADLFYALRELKDPIVLKNASELTMFADYRIPQILRELGIFEYSEDLCNIIDNKNQILPNSHTEVEIRACTIICVEMIKSELKKIENRKDVLSLEIDYVLWNEGEKVRKLIKPHHRTLTIFY